MQRKWMVTAVVCAGVFMSSLDLFIVNIAFPSISRSFGEASLSSLSWIVSGYAIVFAALLVPAGRWADAFGRKRAFMVGLVVFAAASAVCAASPSIGTLIAARIVQAVGGALVGPAPIPMDVAIEGMPVCSGGAAIAFDKRALERAVVREEVEYEITLPGEGAETEVFFSDLSHEYVTINADYTT